MKQHESIGKEEIENCAFEGLEDNEEGIPYVMGNTLWAFYQFSVLIVLLSVLRARMVNTYHRIFKEADVQWKFFRFVIFSCSWHCFHEFTISRIYKFYVSQFWLMNWCKWIKTDLGTIFTLSRVFGGFLEPPTHLRI